MVTPTFVFSVTIVTMAVLAFGTTQTYLRFSSSGGPKSCSAGSCVRPGSSRSAAGAGRSAAATPAVTASGSTRRDSGRPDEAHASKVSVAYRTLQTVPGGFVGMISITDRRAQSIGNWRLRFTYPGVRIMWMKGATWVPGGDGGTVEPLREAPPLQQGRALPVTFAATGEPASPSDCFFDDVRCHVGG